MRMQDAPVGDDEALGDQGLKADIVGAEAIAASTRTASSSSNSSNNRFCNAIDAPARG